MTRSLRDSIGRSLGASDWFTIDQPLINQFAEITGDHQFIHVDKAAARKTEFGDTIAHGMLTLSLSVSLIEPFLEPYICGKTVLNYGSNKVRFLRPVKCDSKVRLKPEILSVVEKNDDQLLVTINAILELKNESKPAFVAELLVLII